ncbi:TRAP transporter permease [Salibacterium sp. K-3]
MEQNEETARYRDLRGPEAVLFKTLVIAITVTGILFILSVQDFFGIAVMLEQYAGLFLAFMLPALYIGVPRSKKSSRKKVAWYDWIFACVGGMTGLYVAVNYQSILHSFNDVTPLRFFLGISAVFLVLEALRRLMGWTLIIVILVFMSYALVAPYMPGIFQGQETSPGLLLSYLYLDTSSMLDLLYLAATVALAFILFGQTLLKFNGGDIINNIALRLFGRFRGGPAKVSVVGSSMVGSVTGDPVSNVVLTGNITIPLMTRNGYSRAQAGAVEVVSSTGGMVTPPIMGIVAFMIAENLGVHYSEVVLAAVVPALLYYICIFTQVDLKAAENNAGKMEESMLPSWSLVLKTGWMLIPVFACLIYFLFFLGYPPSTAGVYAAGLAAVVLMLQKDVRKNVFTRIIQAFESTGKMLLEIGVILAAAGFMVGILSITGLGFNLVFALTQLGQYGLFVLLAASAIVCIILGMGLPGIAAYAIVAVMVAPSLVELGVAPLAAHLFVFYFSIVSNFTPPMAVACFAASPIAQTSPHKIGFSAVKLGVMAYILPFIFVYNPSILLGVETGSGWIETLIAFLLPVISCLLIGISFSGYLLKPLSFMNRGLLLASAVLIVLQFDGYAWVTHAVGGGIALGVILIEVFGGNKKTEDVPTDKYGHENL